MIKIITKIILTLPLVFLFSCGGLSDAGKILRNEKTRTTDEFLVKKRAPLTLPPQYEIIPEPRSLKKNENDKDKKINKILKITEEKNSKKSGSMSVEQSIINQIKKIKIKK